MPPILFVLADLRWNDEVIVLVVFLFFTKSTQQLKILHYVQFFTQLVRACGCQTSKDGGPQHVGTRPSYLFTSSTMFLDYGLSVLRPNCLIISAISHAIFVLFVA